MHDWMLHTNVLIPLETVWRLTVQEEVRHHPDARTIITFPLRWSWLPESSAFSAVSGLPWHSSVWLAKGGSASGLLCNYTCMLTARARALHNVVWCSQAALLIHSLGCFPITHLGKLILSKPTDHSEIWGEFFWQPGKWMFWYNISRFPLRPPMKKCMHSWTIVRDFG